MTIDALLAEMEQVPTTLFHREYEQLYSHDRVVVPSTAAVLLPLVVMLLLRCVMLPLSALLQLAWPLLTLAVVVAAVVAADACEKMPDVVPAASMLPTARHYTTHHPTTT